MKKITFLFLLLIPFCFLYSGCAAVINGKTQSIKVVTDPRGATATYQGQTKTTPCKFNVKRSPYNASISIEKDGYMPATVLLKSKLSGLSLVDTMFTASMNAMLAGKNYRYTPSTVKAKLVRIEDAKHAVVSVDIESLEVSPEVVSPGGEFGFSVKYKVKDNTVLTTRLDVDVTYSILQDGTLLFSDTISPTAEKNSSNLTTKSELLAGSKKGTYTLRVQINYQDKQAQTEKAFRIQ